MLEEQGRIDRDEKISRWFPNLPGVQNPAINGYSGAFAYSLATGVTITVEATKSENATTDAAAFDILREVVKYFTPGSPIIFERRGDAMQVDELGRLLNAIHGSPSTWKFDNGLPAKGILRTISPCQLLRTGRCTHRAVAEPSRTLGIIDALAFTDDRLMRNQ
jgi:hypothetical protein